MKPINKIFEYLKESNLTMIGYKYQDERIKDELISKLPHIEIFEFDSSFSVMATLGIKINVVKNRFDGDNISISLDGLKYYKYICSYEDNK